MNILQIDFLLLLAVIGLVLYQNHAYDGAIRKYWPAPRFRIEEVPSLKGKVAVITGANVGLGKETAIQLARKGAKVVLASRSSMDEVVKEIQAEGGDVLAMKLDLSDSRSIYAFAQEFRRTKLPIHILMLNAGVMLIPAFQTTKDGFEMQMGVNWIGHFYLQHLLQDIVEESAPSRIVIVSSLAHQLFVKEIPPVGLTITDTKENRNAYQPTRNYGLSKLLNILHAKELDARMRDKKKQVAVLAVHPGSVDTELARFMIETVQSYLGSGVAQVMKVLLSYFSLTVQEGAITQIWAATSPEIDQKNLSGSYAVPQARVILPTEIAQNVELRKRVWAEGEAFIANFPK